MKSLKRIVSLLLVLVMVLGVMPLAMAAEDGSNDLPLDTEGIVGTLTVKFHSNYPAATGMGNVSAGISVETGKTFTYPGWSWWKAPADYTFGGWSDGTNVYDAGDSFTFSGTEDETFNVYAVWEPIADDPSDVPSGGGSTTPPADDPTDDPSDEPSDAPAAPKVGSRFYKAIFVNCTDNSHDEYLTWKVDKAYTPKWDSRYNTWYIVATVKNLKNYVPYYGYGYDYDYDYDCHCGFYSHTCTKSCTSSCDKSYKHYCDKYYGQYTDDYGFICDLFCEYFDNYKTSATKSYYGHKVTSVDDTITLHWNKRYDKWVIADEAEIRMTCGTYNSTSCNSRHSHTIRYTDGVANKVIFKDKTYTVRHNAKTPTVKDPVRDGYRFAGWSPKVSTYADECVTYVAQWIPGNAPALTTEHVAYLKGYGKGYVHPEAVITRAEAATILYRLLDQATLKAYYTAYNTFTDVSYGDWYNDAISTLANAGVIKGNSGNYYPNEAITRAELITMLTRFAYGSTAKTSRTSFSDVSTSYWAYDEIALAQELGWIKGYGGSTFNPDGSISRAEVAAILNRMLNRSNCNVKDTKNYVDNPAGAWFYRDILEASIAH